MALLYEEMDLVRQNLEIEKRVEKQRRKELLKEIIQLTTYTKGFINKEVFELPMPSSDSFLSNRELKVKLYGLLMLESNWGGTFLNPDNRYIYKDKFDVVLDEICKDLSISKSTAKRHINKLRKCDIKAVELCSTSDNVLFYRLNYGVYTDIENIINLTNYVTITNLALRKLINATSENALRIYLVFLYLCRDGECHVTQELICNKIGLKHSSRKKVTDCIDILKGAGFIKVRVEYTSIVKMNKENIKFEQVIPKYYYSLSNDYLELKPKSRRKREV